MVPAQSAPPQASTEGVHEDRAISATAEIRMNMNTAKQEQIAVIYARVSSEEQVQVYSP